MNPSIQLKNTTSLSVLIALTLGCFGLSPQARAVCQEGCDAINNTFLGEEALVNNTTGFQNTATGWVALSSNTTGTGNTATGASSLRINTTGNNNTATGSGALNSNTSGDGNTATGDFALLDNTTGNNNTAHGLAALETNQTGNDNTAIGDSALLQNKGSNNIALGSGAGLNLRTGHHTIYIGNAGLSSNEHATIRIGTTGTHGRTFIAGISGVTVPAGVGVIVGTDGKLGTVVSSERFKDAIKSMDKASEAILALKPVTFRYKHELDPNGIPQFGLVAEDVEKVNPDLVARDDQGKPYTVRYEAVNAMLLNEFLKEHKKVEQLKSTMAKQEATINQLKSTVAQQQKDFQATARCQQKQIEALTAGLQKVSAQVKMIRPAPQTVVDNH
jgi:trimeric autotransporter adhesin